MKKERNGAVPGQETNLEYTAHLLEAAAAAAPGSSDAVPPPLGSHTGSSCLYDWDSVGESKQRTLLFSKKTVKVYKSEDGLLFGEFWQADLLYIVHPVHWVFYPFPSWRQLWNTDETQHQAQKDNFSLVISRAEYDRGLTRNHSVYQTWLLNYRYSLHNVLDPFPSSFLKSLAQHDFFRRYCFGMLVRKQGLSGFSAVMALCYPVLHSNINAKMRSLWFWNFSISLNVLDSACEINLTRTYLILP